MTRLGEDARVRGLGALLGRPGHLVELAEAVELAGVELGRRVALALDRAHVEEDRAGDLLEVLEQADEAAQVVAVERPEVLEAQFLEEQVRHDEVLEALLDPRGALARLLADQRQQAQQLPDLRLGLAVQRAAGDPRQVLRDAADARRDREVVVVEDDEQVLLQVARVVEALVGEAAGQRAVADHGDDLVVVPHDVARRRHAERGRDRGRPVRGAERVVRALVAAREARDAAELAQRAEAVAAAGEELVAVGLVADVPHDAIARGVEHAVERDRQLDYAQGRREVAAGGRDRLDEQLPQFLGDGLELVERERLEIGGRIDVGEQGHGAPGNQKNRFQTTAAATPSPAPTRTSSGVWPRLSNSWCCRSARSS